MFLEVPLAGLAAANADEATAAALQAAIDEAADHEPGTPPFNEADTRFHQILARAAATNCCSPSPGGSSRCSSRN